jgi:hypothetical protein
MLKNNFKLNYTRINHIPRDYTTNTPTNTFGDSVHTFLNSYTNSPTNYSHINYIPTNTPNNTPTNTPNNTPTNTPNNTPTNTPNNSPTNSPITPTNDCIDNHFTKEMCIKARCTVICYSAR